MSAVAASAAVGSRVPAQRRPRLRSLPVQAGPVPFRGPGQPLALGRDTRARLGTVVRTLLGAPGADAVRLAVLVLASRTPSGSGVVEIRTRELARWIGMSESYVASVVVPGLRRSRVVDVETATGEFGQDVGLRCRVVPLWEAMGRAGDPLALTKGELATLLRLLEAVMAPGWAHRDGSVTPAGLLGERRGRGAATDRLALLLLVLEARDTGRVRLCGGSADIKRGRAATTVAQLLGCTASAGERVLERLEAWGLVRRVRLQTASGLAQRTRLVVPAVAAAHSRREGATAGQGGRRSAAEPEFSEPDVTAGPGQGSQAGAEQQVSGAQGSDGTALAEPDVAASLHTDHSPVVTLVVSAEPSQGFSGEGRGGNPGRPERAGVHGDQDQEAAAVEALRLIDGEGGPLRGEQPAKSPSSVGEKSGCGPVAGDHVRSGDSASQGRQHRGRVPLPSADLQAVLAPVDLVWARLERPAARRIVEAAARNELKAVEGYASRTDAPKVLADRLARRLADQIRLAGPIHDPVGWLLARGLPQRQECTDVRCDDGTLLDSSRDCPRCEDRQVDRRAQRHAIAATVDTAMSDTSEAERRTATEQQLHETVTTRAWARERAWKQVRAQQAADSKTRAAAAPPAVGGAVLSRVPLPGPPPAIVMEAADAEAELVLEDLTREQVLDWRTRAAADHTIVHDHLARYGEASAQKLFTRAFVTLVQRLSRLEHLNLGYTTWELA